MLPQRDLHIILRIVFYGSYLLFPILFLNVVFFFTSDCTWLYLFCALFLIVLCIYSRFIEPYRIKIVKTTLGTKRSKKTTLLRIVVCADMHLGMYKGDKFLTRIVKEINALNPDLVLIPGDFIYEPTEADLPKLFVPFKDITVPIYAVTGNHDAEEPGFISSTLVRAALSKYIHVIDNKKQIIEIQGSQYLLIGLSDIWEGETDFTIVPKEKSVLPTIILIHNPDGSYMLPDACADLVVAGHTHGGQVRVPLLYHKIIPSKYGFNRGWYKVHNNPIFVTSGLGEVVLPMRLGVPPEIVLVEFAV
ncbi:MAG: metallophosphoesterase [Candidatus Gracilibacteria bacterium]